MSTAADVLVFLRCPSCAYTWHAATIVPDMWWGKGAKSEKVAAQCYCPKCEQAPPMVLINNEEQPRLF